MHPCGSPACASAPRSGAAVPGGAHRGPPRQHSPPSSSGSVPRSSPSLPAGTARPHSHFLGHIRLPELLLHHRGGGGARAAARGDWAGPGRSARPPPAAPQAGTAAPGLSPLREPRSPCGTRPIPGGGQGTARKTLHMGEVELPGHGPPIAPWATTGTTELSPAPF